jgi:hypothetical protein
MMTLFDGQLFLQVFGRPTLAASFGPHYPVSFPSMLSGVVTSGPVKGSTSGY